MEQYNVTGMSCAACSSRVEKAVNKVPGVTSCSVSLLTNSMRVEGTATASAIISAVEQAGYGCSLKGASGQKESSSDAEKALEDHETPVLKKRLIASAGFLLVLMYFSMGHMMWGWPLPAWFDGNHIAMGLVQLLLAGIVIAGTGRITTGNLIFDIGILFFAGVVVFHLVTLPVELNASNRAIAQLQQLGIVGADETKGAKKVLSAAAMTYVAALATAVLNLVRLLLIRGRD